MSTHSPLAHCITADTTAAAKPTPENLKKLLSDPAAYLSSLQSCTGSTTEILFDNINSLFAERSTLEAKEKSLQTQTGIISRQIGEAKRNGLPTEEILASMRALSTEKKTLKNRIKLINQTLLETFEENTAISGTDAADNVTILPLRHYPGCDTEAGKITISLLDTVTDADAWNRYVDSNTAACIHHRAEWRDILKQTYGHESIYLCAHDHSKKIVGILPLVQIKSRLFGNQLVSMPFFQRGGALADTAEIEQALIQKAITHGKKLGVDHIEYRDDISREYLSDKLSVQTHKVNMVLSLPETREDLWQGFTAKLRAQIRRPQREEVETCIGSSELLNDFYHVYSRNMRDLGSPVQSKELIRNSLDIFPENSWLVVIKYKQRPVAAAFLLAFGDTMEIPLASTVRDVNHLSMNMLLYWEVLSLAIEKNYSRFDFGRSSKDAGTYRFKQQWGAKPKQLYWHYWLGQAETPPSLNPSSPKYALVIATWKRLPVWFTRWLGPKLVKNIA